MEHFLRCYFDYFNDLPRNSLHDRRKRKNMVEYISTLIEACSAVENGNEESCRVAIRTIIGYHEDMRNSNGTVCMMGKYHNILYVAVKLCYIWQLKDTETIERMYYWHLTNAYFSEINMMYQKQKKNPLRTLTHLFPICIILKDRHITEPHLCFQSYKTFDVSLLLEHIYSCEKTFERILIGALFGNSAPHYVAGWKSDFDSQEENLRAVVYFLDKANKGCLQLPFVSGSEKQLFRFIDLPIESCGKASPLKIAVELGLPDKLLIFLRFGASASTPLGGPNVFEHLLNRLSEFNHVYPYNLVACLQLLLRVVPVINWELGEHKLLSEAMLDTYSDLIHDGILPPSRCGISPPELRHLCRCLIRERLRKNYQLPNGIRSLGLPESLWGYLDILQD